MKALSIRQPWVWAILNAGKTVENRTWSTTWRGPILLHAAKGLTRVEYEDALVDFGMIARTAGWPEGLTCRPAFETLERGGIVGRARIVDCVSTHRSPWFFGRYGLVLADVEPLPFTPLKGALGLFEVPEGVLAP